MFHLYNLVFWDLYIISVVLFCMSLIMFPIFLNYKELCQVRTSTGNFGLVSVFSKICSYKIH